MAELLYKDGILRVCTCAENDPPDSEIQKCQRQCAGWEKWDNWCYHYRTNGSRHCDYTGDKKKYVKKDDDY